jgi:hypothetical protein
MLPPNLGIVSVTRNGVPVGYLVSGSGNTCITEPEEGAGWAGGVVTVEFLDLPPPLDQEGHWG